MSDSRTTNKERLKQITEGIEKGIREMFESDKYKQYLSVMSRFHRYSVNNVMLIHLQRPDATLVAGFSKWRDRFGRHVKKGEKGIQIIAPTPFKKRVEEMKLDPDTKEPMRDKDGEIIMEEKEVQIPMFKIVSVFDVAQTDGKPLPQLANTLTGSVEQYEIFMEALRRSSAVPITFKPLEEKLDGFFSLTDQSITIREGMSEVQTVCATIHEIAHSRLHNYLAPIPEDAPKYQEVSVMGQPALMTTDRILDHAIPEGLHRYDLRGTEQEPDKPATVEDRVLHFFAGALITARPLDIPKNGTLTLNEDPRASFQGVYMSIPEFQQAHQKDQRTKEVEAESVSYSVCSYYGIETSENSFGYIATWSKDKELKELRASLETISKTASALITDIDRNFAEICKERGIDLKARAEQEESRADVPAPEGNVEEPAAQEPEAVTAEQEKDTADPPAPEVSASAPVESADKDEYHLFAADFCDYLEQLYLIDEIDNPFQVQTKENTVPAVANLFQSGSFESTRKILAEAAERGLPNATEMLDRLERLSDQWDTGLQFRLEENPLNDGRSLILAHRDTDAGLHSYGVLFSGPTEVCRELLQGLNEGTVTARQVREMSREAEESQKDLSSDAPVQPAESPEQMEMNRQDATEEKTASLDTYPMPDEAVSLSDLEAAGYLDGDLLPLTRERALTLLDEGLTVYGITAGGQADMCFDSADMEILPETAIFAVPKEEWEASGSFDTCIQDRLNRQEERENAFREYPGDAYAIYQVKQTEEQRFLRYEPFERLKESPKRKNYDLIYTRAGLPEGDTTGKKLGNLFYDFNMDHPPDYHAPSMSVSDIIALKQDGVVSYHYCDSIGFRELPDFNRPENYLKNAELAMEDDANMIDGIINNGPRQSPEEKTSQPARDEAKEPAAPQNPSGPTVAELEAQIRAGQTISLMDLANAVHAEQAAGREAGGKKRQRVSVLAKLREPLPPRDGTKEKTAKSRNGKEL